MSIAHSFGMFNNQRPRNEVPLTIFGPRQGQSQPYPRNAPQIEDAWRPSPAADQLRDLSGTSQRRLALQDGSAHMDLNAPASGSARPDHVEAVRPAGQPAPALEPQPEPAEALASKPSRVEEIAEKIRAARDEVRVIRTGTTKPATKANTKAATKVATKAWAGAQSRCGNYRMHMQEHKSEVNIYIYIERERERERTMINFRLKRNTQLNDDAVTTACI